MAASSCSSISSAEVSKTPSAPPSRPWKGFNKFTADAILAPFTPTATYQLAFPLSLQQPRMVK
jgi:hypothetical protein